MKRIAGSLALAGANLVTAGIGFVCLRVEGLDYVGMIAALAVVPVILLVTLIYVVLDLRRTQTRLQALIALAISIVPFWLRLSIGT